MSEPAFPTDSARRIDNRAWHFTGLTKRELFAVMAMQGLLSDTLEPTTTEATLALQSVECADALIAALEEE